MTNVLVFFIILLLPLFLHVYLSRSISKWPGLILPIISFTLSIVTVLGMAQFEDSTKLELIFQAISVFIMANIPTIILLGIYVSIRAKLTHYKTNTEIEKMNIKDL